METAAHFDCKFHRISKIEFKYCRNITRITFKKTERLLKKKREEY